MTLKLEAKGPFAPTTTAVNNTSASQSSRPVTIPHLPELYQPLDNVLAELFPSAQPSQPALKLGADAPSHPFMTALKNHANQTKTWNGADAYKSTLSPTLDAFTALSQSTDPQAMSHLLSTSWASDPDLTLRIIWNLRSIHDGKSAREPFYRAFGWLYIQHPKTAIANLRYLVEPCVKRVVKKKPAKVESVEGVEDMEVITKEEATEANDVEMEKKEEEFTTSMPHGYWKDLLNILVLAATNELGPTSQFNSLHSKQEQEPESKKRKAVRNRRKPKRGRLLSDLIPPMGTSEERKKAASERDHQASEDAKKARKAKYISQHDTLLAKLNKNKVFRALYVTIARLFADGLAKDLKILHEVAQESTTPERRIELSYSLSLVGKWAPSIGGSHDRVTNIATPIAELLYSQDLFPVSLGQLTQPLSTDAAHQLRAAYTRWCTSPLRRFLEIPEVNMSANQWGKIKYTRVPSKCMQLNKKRFLSHDEERFSQYLLDVAQGKKKISGATLLPHELLVEALKLPNNEKLDKVEEMNMQVVNGQWKSLIERVKESGTLDNAMAVCDVSGSMGSLYVHRNRTGGFVEPIIPAVALSILLAQIASPPWNNSFITFSATPELVNIDPDNLGLAQTAHKMAGSSWGMNTDFNAVFKKLILPAAVSNNLKPEQMIKRLFVFTDMQFDQSLSNRQKGTAGFKTEHQKVKEAFEAKGYELPEIVYWNLSGYAAVSVTKNDAGVALMSGFSPGLLKVFLEGGEVEAEKETGNEEGEEKGKEKKKLDPVETMVKALTKESFEGLKVYD